MSGTAKLLTILILLLSAAFAAVSATLYAVRRDWKAEAGKAKKERLAVEEKLTGERDTLKDKNAQLLKLKDRAEANANATKVALDSEKKVTADLRKREDQLTIAVKEQRLIAKQLTGQLDEAKAENKRLAVEVAKTNKALDAERETTKTKQGKIEDLTSQNKDLAGKLDTTEKTLTDTSGELGRAKDVLTQLAKANVDIPGMTRTPVNGQVVKAQDSIVVINRGEKHGVRVGAKFTIYSTDPGRGYVGKMAIKEVRMDMAVGAPIRELTRKSIQPGDYVTNTIR